jgi:hypothetical protein
MTVQELIEQLGYMDPNAEVHFSYNYGDHWRTQVAPQVESVEPGFVVHSEYHRMPKVVELDYDDEEEQFQGKEVVIIG